ncbi:hypothetical protein MKJ04_07350 [Pontibacter sp. E15-1]|uniref:hypothetical protein n=1 Tax=Pontibacter sp. E15-1 TaxID=2919918 RepID=UPI001F4FEAE0|nr:hypothetical protein [Pontibacter sp. E15-1]MCJ8164657.1 hypothetical protein [Pontibacter sp. E15-1]
MKNKLYLLALACAAFSCGPKNEEVTEEQVTLSPTDEALDSIVDTRKDALQTDENETNPTLPLPPEVMGLLTQQYTGWAQPELTSEAKEQAENHEQGPMIVRGDFDGDTRQDVALQLSQNDQLIIVAALQRQEGIYTLQKLKQDILFNDRGKLKSMYYLYAVEEGEKLRNEQTMTETEAPYKAIGIGIEGNDTVYLYDNGTFGTFSRVE